MRVHVIDLDGKTHVVDIAPESDVADLIAALPKHAQFKHGYLHKFGKPIPHQGVAFSDGDTVTIDGRLKGGCIMGACSPDCMPCGCGFECPCKIPFCCSVL